MKSSLYHMIFFYSDGSKAFSTASLRFVASLSPIGVVTLRRTVLRERVGLRHLFAFDTAAEHGHVLDTELVNGLEHVTHVGTSTTSSR